MKVNKPTKRDRKQPKGNTKWRGNKRVPN
jgi:hypothetical protein